LDMMNFAQVIVSLSKWCLCQHWTSLLYTRKLVYKLILMAFCITALVQGNKKLQTFCHMCYRLPSTDTNTVFNPVSSLLDNMTSACVDKNVACLRSTTTTVYILNSQ
jgi:hypothetical protein